MPLVPICGQGWAGQGLGAAARPWAGAEAPETHPMQIGELRKPDHFERSKLTFIIGLNKKLIRGLLCS